ncbi:MAG: signal peptidase I [candidate division WOR-3 bacterium]|nr:signal peptidase I [candidate division WOR-3 bacterium]MCX7757133.1 signal peptidase I [candidate division WOR-3 bacterium]MDW7987801.1 signal peptidase I [candidate division WOR-3 bacterium]
MKAIIRFLKSWLPVIIAVLLLRSFVVEAFMVPTPSMESTIMVGDFLLVNKFIYGIKIPFTNKTLIPVRNPRRGEIIVFRYHLDPEMPEPRKDYIRIFPKALPLLPLYWNKRSNFFTWYTPRNFVKRCIAVAGDTVEIINKKVYINGKMLYEPYVQHIDRRIFLGLNLSPEEFQKEWVNARFIERSDGYMVRDNFGPIVVPEGTVFALGDNRDNSSDGRFFGPIPLEYIRGKPLVIYFSSKAAPNIARIILSPHQINWSRIGMVIR